MASEDDRLAYIQLVEEGEGEEEEEDGVGATFGNIKPTMASFVSFEQHFMCD